MKDFIGKWSKAVPDDFCDWLVKCINESSTNPKQTAVLENSNPHRKDIQFALEAFYPTAAKDLMQIVGNCLYDYVDKECPFLIDNSFVSSITLLQKTKPMEGFHNFHCEDMSFNTSNRTMAWMVYLNDVEEGGETEFLYQQRKFTPEKGTVLIWPASYTHPHRGNPPISDKYIATGWYQVDTGSIYDHILKKNQKIKTN